MSQYSSYGFLPFLKLGIGSKIQQEDITPTSSSSNVGTMQRAEITVDVTYIDAGNAVTSIPTKTAKVIGPADIQAISSQTIVRTEPMDMVFDFERNLLPFIEFYEEDFLWRYTPATPMAGSKKLRPWLALMILKDEEFTIIPPSENSKNAILKLDMTVIGTIENVMHPADEHWAYGHIHASDTKSGTTPFTETDYIDQFQTDVQSNPNLAVCRLLSSRKLEAKTSYTAFLIPAFETGRLAGLGLPTNLMGSLVSSWGFGSNANTDRPYEYPVYKQWRFGTAALGDFESLARAIKPRVADSNSSSKLVDITKIGVGLDTLASNTPNPDEPTNANKIGSVNFEGGLVPVDFDPELFVDASTTNPFNEELKKVLNFQEEYATSNTLSITNTNNPYITGTPISLNEDPIVLPPIYGQYHAEIQTIDVSNPKWLQELNLNIKNRIAAGLGAQIVKDRQEDFMNIAWNQLGEIKLVNELISKSEFALQAAKSVYKKHIVHDILVSSLSDDDRFGRVIKTGSLILNRVADSTATSSISLKKVAQDSYLSKGSLNAGFKKVVRNRSKIVQNAGSLLPISVPLVTENVVNEIDANNIKIAGPFQKPNEIAEFTSANNYFTSNQGINVPSNAIGSSSQLMQAINVATTITNEWKDFYEQQFYDFKLTYEYYTQLNANNQENNSSISNKTLFSSDALDKTNPDTTIPERTKNRIKDQLGSNFFGSGDALKHIMAYPVIEEPMSNELFKISTDYLFPGLANIPNNSITLLAANNPFIESFMVGLNHEFARELLWREYPTDQRGSCFQVFWDKLDDANNATTNWNDINPIHQWNVNNGLGGNMNATGSVGVVLLIKSDLLKKFPNALIYAQIANAPDATSNGAKTLENLSATLLSSQPDPSKVRFPILRANLQPDVVALGFNLSKDEITGVSSTNGWFFVFHERPGSVRFGLDEEVDPLPINPLANDSISWSHMGANAQTVRFNGVSISSSIPVTPTPLNPEIHWDSSIHMDASKFAWVLYQKPVIVAIHGSDLLPA